MTILAFSSTQCAIVTFACATTQEPKLFTTRAVLTARPGRCGLLAPAANLDYNVRLFNGNTDGEFWHAHASTTNYETNAWWQVDLGSVQPISSIQIWGRTDCCPEHTSNFYVFVSDNPFTSYDLNTTLNQTGVSNYYFPGYSGTPGTINVNRTGRYVRVQFAASQYLVLAEVKVLGATTVGAGGIHWLVADQLGTPRMVFDQTGSLANLSRHDYLPFGEEISAFGGRTTAQGYNLSDGIRQQFTGYERDAETGLDYAHARYDGSVQGRFLSVDPLMTSASITNPQSLNRYSYCLNNPMNSTDPSGMMTMVDASTSWSEVADTFWGENIDFNRSHHGGPDIIQNGLNGFPDRSADDEETTDDVEKTVPQQQDGKVTIDQDPSIAGLPSPEIYEPTGQVTVVLVSLTPITSTPTNISDRGLNFLKRVEGGPVLRLYNDQGGHCTIGYGHLVDMRSCNNSKRAASYRSGITEQQASQFLRGDVADAERSVRTLVHVPLSQNQFDSLVSFTFNIGPDGFRRSSARRELNAGNFDAVPSRMARWNTTGDKVSRGLIRRRAEEGNLFRGR